MKKNFWKNKRVFITGHTGFKGSWLCIFLSMLGANVTGYALKPKTKPSLFKLAKIDKILEKSIYSDIKDYKKLNYEIKKFKPEIIFHLAAQPLVRYSYLNPKETFETNILGTLNILEIVRNYKKIKTTIIITSDKVYDVKKNKIYNETDPLKGLDPYSSSKVSCEHLYSSYMNSFFKNNTSQRLATVRAGNVIGGGDYSHDRLIPDILHSAKKLKKIILRNPNSTRPWQHVLEPLYGYLILAEKLYKNESSKITKQQSWNFGPNISNCKSVMFVASFFAKKLKLKIKVLKKQNKIFKPETHLLRLNNTKSKKVLKCNPKWNLIKTLNKILEWNQLIKNKKPRDVCETQIKEYLSKK